ncbi:prolyl oligopeptidase family serine peptidase [Ideonella sp.]|uniref:prolyl oligopeptidase family serine peptidase n=1 Tax=Ideonella sp. TaxID=1929293 RepID=UPI0037BF30F5
MDGVKAGVCKALVWGLCAVAWVAQANPSRPQQWGPVVEKHFGVAVPDPFRGLEQSNHPRVKAWLAQQSREAEASLSAMPGQADLLRQMVEQDADLPLRVTDVRLFPNGQRLFLRRMAGEDQFKLVLQPAGEAPAKVLVDPEAVRRGRGPVFALNYFQTSLDGRWLAYALSRDGSEDATLRVMDTTSGKVVGPAIDRAEVGAVSFSPDGQHLAVLRLQAPGPQARDQDRYLNSAVWLMQPGAPLQQARKIFGPGVPGVRLKPEDVPEVEFSHDGRWAIATVYTGTQQDLGLWLAPASSVLAGRPQWRKLAGAADRVVGSAYGHGWLYLRSRQQAPNYQILALDLRAEHFTPTLADARVVVPHSERVVMGMTVAEDGLYVESREGNVKRLSKRSHRADAALLDLALPIDGAFSLTHETSLSGVGHPLLPGLVLDLQGWLHMRQLYQVRADGAVHNTGWQPTSAKAGQADAQATEVLVPSHDGALVPMSIVHRKGLVLDGSHPTVLLAYGAYGHTEEPRFSTFLASWVKAGGVYAVANVRGGGAKGDAWYEAGRKATKANTWLDTIACARFLQQQGWTSPAKLGLWGASAGGIAVGRAMTEQPDLFGAVVLSSAALDMVSAEREPYGPTNVPEFGTVRREADFKALLAMSTYHHIRDGVAYPAVLITHGMTDPRVTLWNSSKTAARLQAASRSGKPVWLWVDDQLGHSLGNTRAQELRGLALVQGFFRGQLGLGER